MLLAGAELNNKQSRQCLFVKEYISFTSMCRPGVHDKRALTHGMQSHSMLQEQQIKGRKYTLNVAKRPVSKKAKLVCAHLEYLSLLLGFTLEQLILHRHFICVHYPSLLMPVNSNWAQLPADRPFQ